MAREHGNSHLQAGGGRTPDFVIQAGPSDATPRILTYGQAQEEARQEALAHLRLVLDLRHDLQGKGLLPVIGKHMPDGPTSAIAGQIDQILTAGKAAERADQLNALPITLSRIETGQEGKEKRPHLVVELKPGEELTEAQMVEQTRVAMNILGLSLTDPAENPKHKESPYSHTLTIISNQSAYAIHNGYVFREDLTTHQQSTIGLGAKIEGTLKQGGKVRIAFIDREGLNAIPATGNRILISFPPECVDISSADLPDFLKQTPPAQPAIEAGAAPEEESPAPLVFRPLDGVGPSFNEAMEGVQRELPAQPDAIKRLAESVQSRQGAVRLAMQIHRGKPYLHLGHSGKEEMPQGISDVLTTRADIKTRLQATVGFMFAETDKNGHTTSKQLFTVNALKFLAANLFYQNLGEEHVGTILMLPTSMDILSSGGNQHFPLDDETGKPHLFTISQGHALRNVLNCAQALGISKATLREMVKQMLENPDVDGPIPQGATRRDFPIMNMILSQGYGIDIATV